MLRRNSLIWLKLKSLNIKESIAIKQLWIAPLKTLRVRLLNISCFRKKKEQMDMLENGLMVNSVLVGQLFLAQA